MLIARRLVQVLIAAVVVAVPFFHLYNVEKYAKDSFSYSAAAEKIYGVGGFREAVVDWLSLVFSRYESLGKIPLAISGSPWSLNVFGYNVSDPLAAVGASLAGGGFYWPFLSSVLLLTVLTLLFGRVFCGWLCPYHLVAEMNDKLRRLLGRMGLAPHDLRLKRGVKFFALVILLALSFAAGSSLFSHIYPPLILGREVFYYAFYGVAGFGFFFILFLLFTELTVSERWWCRYMCPGGALYSLLGSMRIVRLVRIDRDCNLCGECDKACPFGLLPMSDQMGMECDNCGTCKNACPLDAMEYRLMTVWAERRMIRGREAAGGIKNGR